jgi:hypothetical protein
MSCHVEMLLGILFLETVLLARQYSMSALFNSCTRTLRVLSHRNVFEDLVLDDTWLLARIRRTHGLGTVCVIKGFGVEICHVCD